MPSATSSEPRCIEPGDVAADLRIPASASVRRAMDHLHQGSALDCTAEQLAGVAGVTLPVLRRNFKNCLGLTLTQFMLEARLQWARERLGSNTESRSIAELAAVIGLSGVRFSRVYQRIFGETPTRTRMRAFHTLG